MTAERHELHELVDALPEDQVAVVLADVRRRMLRTEDRAWASSFCRFHSPSGPQIVRKKSGGDRYWPMTSNTAVDAFAQVRGSFQSKSTAFKDSQNTLFSFRFNV